MKNKKQLTPSEKNKRLVIWIAVCLAGALLLCILLTAILNNAEGGGDEYSTLPPVDPSKLYETYPDDFDIMEYEEYLELDRSVYLIDKQTGVTQSIPYEKAEGQGEGFLLLYDVILAIIDGDYEQYNSYMGDGRLRKDDFTQQQLYDIKISPYSVSESEGSDEYVYEVRYKIHENNGTFRNTIVSDAARVQYFYIDDSTGSLKVMKIVE